MTVMITSRASFSGTISISAKAPFGGEVLSEQQLVQKLAKAFLSTIGADPLHHRNSTCSEGFTVFLNAGTRYGATVYLALDGILEIEVAR